MANVLKKYPPLPPPGEKTYQGGPGSDFFYRYVLPYRGPRQARRQDGRTDGQGRREGQGRGAGQGRRAGGRKGQTGQEAAEGSSWKHRGRREICFDALVFAIRAGICL